MSNSSKGIEPYLMALLASRLGSISVQMNNIMIKSARSSVLALARDCSTAILDAKGDVLAFPAGFPVHVGGTSLAGKALLEMKGDQLKPGDAYLLNSPYHGNTHPADHTILVPVFHEEELIFICVCRGHQADIGNSIPTTYHTTARDLYEEGALIFPCVKVQENYSDIEDIINMCKMRIRVPDVWYGDYLAMIGAARIGERELISIAEKYDLETINNFCTAWHEYGRQRMIEEIRKFPAGEASYQTTHDPVPGILPEGVNVRVKLTVNPNEGWIECDFTDNQDSLPCGLNVSEATLTSAARTAVLNRMTAKDLPHCEGALSCIRVKMREGSVVGKSKHPFSSSVATTNVNDRAMVAVQCAFNQITDHLGMAEPKYDMGPAIAVISGTDSRKGEQAYVTQIIGATAGFGGVNGRDGYCHYAISNGGMYIINSVEMVENQYPIRYLKQEIAPDKIGSGCYDSGPATETILSPVSDQVTFVYLGDGHHNPAKGAAGGLNGSSSQAFRERVTDGVCTETLEELPMIHQVTLPAGEALRGLYSSGGGFGDPLNREPEKVRHRVQEGWISPQYAENVYGVVLEASNGIFEVNKDETEKLRSRLKNERA
jgi:N-methylhydantoinase B